MKTYNGPAGLFLSRRELERMLVNLTHSNIPEDIRLRAKIRRYLDDWPTTEKKP